MSRRLLCIPVLIAVAGACAQEWVATRDEIEMIPLADARRICDDYARRKAERQRLPGAMDPTARDTMDRTVYRYEFRRCMTHQGWELRRKEPEEPEEPEASAEDLDE